MPTCKRAKPYFPFSFKVSGGALFVYDSASALIVARNKETAKRPLSLCSLPLNPTPPHKVINVSYLESRAVSLILLFLLTSSDEG